MTQLSNNQIKKNKALAHNFKYSKEGPLKPYLVDVSQHLTSDTFQNMMVLNRQKYLANYSLVGIHTHEGKSVPDQFHLRKIFKPTSKYLGNGELRG